MTPQHKVVPGTRPLHHPHTRRGEALPRDHRVEVALVLRPGGAGGPPDLTTNVFMDLEALADHNAPEDPHVEQVLRFAQEHGLTVKEVSRARHDVILEGTTADLERAFRVTQHHYHGPHGTYRGHEEEISLPEELHDAVIGITGLDTIPHHYPHVVSGSRGADNHSPGGGAAPIPEIARRYGIPGPPSGDLPRIALLEFGGGYHPADIQASCSRLGLQMPTLSDIHVQGVDGTKGANAPLPVEMLGSVVEAWSGAASTTDLMTSLRAALPGMTGDQLKQVMAVFMATAEVTMDIEVLASIVPGAPIDIYFAPPDGEAWRRGIWAALGHPVGGGSPAAPLPHVLSISWGGCECQWGPAKMAAVETALAAAAKLGVTVCCSSGDWGSRNLRTDLPGIPSRNVNFPASSPSVLACGGTRIEEPLDVVWNEPVLGQQMASGGGMSGFFPRPDYQSHLQTPPPGDTWQARQGGPIAGRWIPDVAANAAFSTGYELQLGGKSYVGGGTSAATPLWAGLIALAAAHAGTRLGHINRHLYRDPSGLRSVTHGQNDLGQDDPPSYHAATGWDPCTGLGIPDGRTIVDQLKSER